MLEEGKSYSGFERNSAFLNLGNTPNENEPRFADISGASGLNLLDDGRSIGIVDWDHDGRQDFWVTNRTGPRLRFQHNESITRNRFISFRLKGVQANRSAIGARLTLSVTGPDGECIRSKTLRAGEGFLAQSSAWIHFGLREKESPGSITVKWPGTPTPESWSGLKAGSFVILEQGRTNPSLWTPPEVSLAASKAIPSPPPLPAAARVFMASPLPFPPTSFLDLDGQEQPLIPTGAPRLINLWASWCGPCQTEFMAWKTGADTLTNTGLRILALSVDDLEKPTAERLDKVNTFLSSLPLPFEIGLAGPDFLETLEVAGRAQLDKFESLPLPGSLLLDRKGRIAVVYQGPVTVDQLKTDIALLDQPGPRAMEAAHFPGRWIEGPAAPSPTVMIDKFMSFGQPEAARTYLDTFARSSENRNNRGLADSYYLIANELRIQKKEDEAIEAYRQSLHHTPDKSASHLELGTLLFRNRAFRKAAPHLQRAAEHNPDNTNTQRLLCLALVQSGNHAEAARRLKERTIAEPGDAVAHLWLGHSLLRLRRAREATHHFREALERQPDSHLAMNELAWVLATHSDSRIRKTKEALELAQRAAELTSHREPGVLDTLAAALAATGDFPRALKTVDQAREIASSQQNQRLLTDLERRRRVYEQGRPYREIAPPAN
ncbi:MAG: tetratricopeptide repeat protein [Verrucomicrobiota bacterium]